MSNKFSMLAAFAAVAMMTDTRDRGRYFNPEDIEPKKKPIPAGCKEYTFYGYTVVASNEKMAIKKCQKLAGIEVLKKSA